MKNTKTSFKLFSLFAINLLLIAGQNAGAEEAKGKLPLVYDPATKKYFIGGSSKFNLKQSEQSQIIDRIEVSVDAGEFRPYGEAVQFQKEGKHTLKFRAVTPVNNWSPVQFVEVFVDLTAPTTELKFPDAKFYKDQTGIFVAQNSAINLVSSDSLSGVASIEYSWDGKTFQDYLEPIVMKELGHKTIYYRSTDRVGNVEMTKQANLVVDGSAPTSTLKLQNADKTVMLDGRTYVSDGAAFTVEASDDASQVKQIWVSLNNGEFTPYIKPIFFLQEGPHLFKYYSVDNVGNKEAEKSIKIYSVSTPPRTTAITSGKIVNTGGINYATHDFQLKFEATNNSVGLERIEVKVDNEPDFRSFLEPVRFKTAGFHNVSYRAVDRIGTAEPAKVFNVFIADSGPVTTISTAQPLVLRGNITYSPAPNVVTFNVGNSSVGVDKTMVSINDGPFTPYQGPLTLQNTQKVYKIIYKSIDKLGNEETPQTMAFHMVGAVPLVDLFISNGQSSEEQVRTDYLEQPGNKTRSEEESSPRAPSSLKSVH